MKKLVIISDARGHNGGLHTFIHNIINHFENDYKIYLILDKSIEGKTLYNISILRFAYLHKIWGRGEDYFHNLFKSIKWTSKFIVVNGSIRSNVLIRKYLNKINTKYVLYEQLVLQEYSKDYCDFYRLNQLNTENVVHVFVSRLNRRYYERLVGTYNQDRCIINNCITTKDSVKRRPSERCDDFIFVGRFDKQKGLDLLIGAWKIFTQSNLNSTLTIVTDNMAEVKALTINMLNVEVKKWERVFNATDYLENYSCLVFPSRDEGFSFLLIEALQTGIPVIATKVPGYEELTENGIAGVFVDTNRLSIASALDEMHTNYFNHIQAASTNNRIINSKFSFNKWVSDISNLINRL